MPSDSFSKNIKGVAGVHLVVAQLSLKGYVALPTTRNLKSVDIVAFNEALDRFAFIQVKATEKPKDGWPVHTIRKEEGWEQDVRRALARSDKFFYVLYRFRLRHCLKVNPPITLFHRQTWQR
jgi:hypothetical protein